MVQLLGEELRNGRRITASVRHSSSLGTTIRKILLLYLNMQPEMELLCDRLVRESCKRDQFFTVFACNPG